MPKQNNRRKGTQGTGPSKTPSRTLVRTFRYMENFELNNSTGSGVNQYSYYSKYVKFNPERAVGFQDAKRTFELWRAIKARVYIAPGYNSYNQTYNSINLDSVAASVVWVASDYGVNETISGVDLMSYQNATFHSLSLNGFKKIVDSALRLNQTAGAPIAILPGSTWLDTSLPMDNVSYSGFQLFTMMQGLNATNYLPKYQMIVEVDCEFKQPAWQNIPTTFEASAFDATLDCDLPDGTTRMYNLVKVTRSDASVIIRFEREDGLPGSLDYTATDFYKVYSTGRNEGYFGGLPVRYTGPTPPKE